VPVGHPSHVTALGMLAKVAREGGVRGLYRGLGVTLLRDIPSYGLYFAIYEVSRLLAPSSCWHVCLKYALAACNAL
jgi:solute carrier family 25 (mitochondrial carnitine/acylcarnitine transporter), member 20/29